MHLWLVSPLQTYESTGDHSVKQGWMAIGSVFEHPYCLAHKSTQSQNQHFQANLVLFAVPNAQAFRTFESSWIIVNHAHTALTNSNVKGAPCPCIWYRISKLQHLEPANIGSFKCALSVRLSTMKPMKLGQACLLSMPPDCQGCSHQRNSSAKEQ